MLANIFTKTIGDRWRGMTVGGATVGLLMIFGMAVYRDIDLGIYTSLPEAFRTMMNIPDGADAAGLAYGAIYSSYGALTLAGLAISLGSGSIAGEEREGTIGLLLGNPKSRTHVLASKATSMILLTSFGALLLWAAGRIAPVLLDVSVTGMRIEALIVHIFMASVFFGFLALAIGAWTGSRGMASGVSAGVLALSFVAVGLFPLIDGWENVAKAFPWYYLAGSLPLNNGLGWSHLGVLGGGSALLAAIAVLGVNRRDLKAQTVGVSLVDRLRSNPMTQKVFDRLAGSTRVSRIWIKTASEHQGLTLVTGVLMFTVMGVMIGAMYPLMDEALLDLSDQFPEALMAMVGGGDMSTAEGFFQVETFGLVAPIAVMVVTVVIAARALAGEEASRTIGLLLANPISRTTVLLEKSVAMLISAIVVGVATFAGVAAGSLVGGLDMDMGNIAATCALVTLLGLAFGALALFLGAATGLARISTYGTIGLALVMFIANAFLPLSDRLAGYAKWSPFYYYLSSDPLLNGMHWGHAGVLAAITVVLLGLAVVAFQRRDLRQTS